VDKGVVSLSCLFICGVFLHLIILPTTDIPIQAYLGTIGTAAANATLYITRARES